MAAQNFFQPIYPEETSSLQQPNHPSHHRNYSYSDGSIYAMVSSGTNGEVDYYNGSQNINFSLNNNNIVRNPDIVIGMSGKVVNVVYQELSSIILEVYNLQSGGFVLSKRITVADAYGEGYVFGNPRIDIHEPSDSIVLTYVAYGQSPTKETYAKIGDVQGNLVSSFGFLGAYNVSQNLGINIDQISGPMSVSIFEKKNNTKLVHFALTYEVGGVQKLRHISMPYSTLSDNNVTNVQSNNTLESSSSLYISWPDVDNSVTNSDHYGFNSQHQTFEEDYWGVVAHVYDYNTSESSIKIYTGYNSGGFITNTVDSTYNCGLGYPAIGYTQDFVNVGYQIKDKESCEVSSDIEAFDVIVASCSYVPTSSSQGFTFYRINNTINGDQDHPALSGASDSVFFRVFVAYDNHDQNQISYKISDNQGRFKMGDNRTREEPKDISMIYRYPKFDFINDSKYPVNYLFWSANGRIIDEGILKSDSRFKLSIGSLPAGVYFGRLNRKTVKILVR